MFKINYWNILSVTLILVGVFGPWFSFNIPMQYGDIENPSYAMGHIYMSPFTITFDIASTSNRSIYEDIDRLSYSVEYFYSTRSTMLGLTCILGAILSFIGEFKNRRNLTLVAGLIAIFSTMFFSLLLPPSVQKWTITNPSIMWGFWVSLLGSILIFLSVGFRMLILKWEYIEDNKPYLEP